MSTNGNGILPPAGESPVTLRDVLEREAARAGAALQELTVLSTRNDPYRCDTPAGHRDGKWFLEQFERAARKYLRGIHYDTASRGNVLRPDGTPYKNTEECWNFLQERAAKCARWLGYVPFDAIADNRTDEAIIHRVDGVVPRPCIEAGFDVRIPNVAAFEPSVHVEGFEGRQKYHFAIFGEKSGLREVVAPIAERFGADAYLGTGELGDRVLYNMARDAKHDGRMMIVFTLADADPAGWQMSISISRKLQAFHDLLFPDMEYAVYPVALTPDQVREYGLPSIPLKGTERRADAWKRAFGTVQTEIDALDALRPDLLEHLLVDAITPFYDPTLRGRVRRAEREWLARAQTYLDDVAGDTLADVRETADEKLREMQTVIDDLNDRVEAALPDINFADLGIEIPLASPSVDWDAMDFHGSILVSSRWSWAEQTRALIERKRYGAE